MTWFLWLKEKSLLILGALVGILTLLLRIEIIKKKNAEKEVSNLNNTLSHKVESDKQTSKLEEALKSTQGKEFKPSPSKTIGRPKKIKLGAILALFFLVSCASKPEIIEVKNKLPLLDIFTVQEIQIEFVEQEGVYCAIPENIDILQSKIDEYKFVIDKYKDQIKLYNDFAIKYNQ